jgi:hypothetical protein
MLASRAWIFPFAFALGCGGASHTTGPHDAAAGPPVDAAVTDAAVTDGASPTADLAGADLGGLNGWTDEGQPTVTIPSGPLSGTLDQLAPSLIAAHPTMAHDLFVATSMGGGQLPTACAWDNGSASAPLMLSDNDVQVSTAIFGPSGTRYVFYDDLTSGIVDVASLASGSAWTTTLLSTGATPPPGFTPPSYPPRAYVVSAAAPERIWGYDQGELYDFSTLGTTSAWRAYDIGTPFGDSIVVLAPGASGSIYAASATAVKTCTLSSSVTCGAAAAGIATGDAPTQIVVSPSTPTTVYLVTSAAAGEKLYRSTDAGAHFSQVALSIDAGARIGRVALHPGNTTKLAVVVQPPSAIGQIWVSTDGATSFASLPMPVTSGNVSDAAIDAAGTLFIVFFDVYSRAL